jgi:hypothetical protein
MFQTEKNLNWPEVLRESDLVGVNVDPRLLTQVPRLMTPEEMLGFSYFPPPDPIIPWEYPDFDSLLKQRDRIRTLGLLPIKSDEVHKRYQSQPSEKLIEDVKEYLGSQRLALSTNRYPYWLPDNLRQYLLWVGDDQVSRNDLVMFSAKAMTVMNLGVDDVIMFERPTQATGRLLRGTFKQTRHLHFWARWSG